MICRSHIMPTMIWRSHIMPQAVCFSIFEFVVDRYLSKLWYVEAISCHKLFAFQYIIQICCRSIPILQWSIGQGVGEPIPIAKMSIRIALSDIRPQNRPTKDVHHAFRTRHTKQQATWNCNTGLVGEQHVQVLFSGPASYHLTAFIILLKPDTRRYKCGVRKLAS